MRYLYILIGIVLHSAQRVQAVAPYKPADSIAITQLLSKPDTSQRALPLFYARQFLGRPYVAHTLELFPDKEQLIVNTRELDCTTLVETVTALVICAQEGKTSFDDYCFVLRQLRYRDGKIDGYPSRLHYFSDWIDDNTRMGFVTEVQQQQAPFSEVQNVSVDYMSKHPSAYVELSRHPEMVKDIIAQERQLTGHRYRYIPKSQVTNSKALRSAVRDGDIIAITTKKAGLDIAHLGFAVWQADGLHLLNASMVHKKVVLEPMTLGQYLSKHPSHTGIRVVRINEKC